MATDAELRVLIKAKDEMSGTLKHATGGVQSMLGALKGIAVAVVSIKTLKAGFDLLNDSIKEAAKVQGIKAAFEGITGAADDMIVKLREGSLGMMSDAKLMESYNLAAQLVSKTFADQLPEAMQYLSKVSAATGQDMDYMMTSLVRGVGRMSPMILDNLAIQVSLSEATDRAAQMFGKEAEELTKAEEQAGMMSVVMEKLAANTANMPEIAGTAAAGFATLGATWDNLKVMLGEAFLPTVNAVLGKLMEWAQGAMPQIEAGMARLQSSLGIVTGAIGTLVGKLNDGRSLLKILADTFPAVFTPEVREIIVGVARSVERIVAGLQAGQSPLKVLADTFPQVFTPEIREQIVAISRRLDDLIAALRDRFTTALSVLWGLWEKIWPAVLEVAQPIWEALLVGVRGAIEGITTIIQTASEIWQQVMELLGSKVEAAKNVIQPIVQAIGDKFKEIFGEISPFVTEMMGKVKGWFDENMPLIRNTIETILTAIQQFWSKHCEDIINVIGAAWEIIKTVISTALDVVLGIVRAAMQIFNGDWEGAWETIKEVLATVWEAIKSILGTALSAIWGLFDTDLARIFTKVKGWASNTWNEIKLWVGNVLGTVGKFGRDVLEAITTPFQQAYDWLHDTFTKIRDFVAGIFDNIKIKTPHFEINWQEAFGVRIPTGVNVNWYGSGLDAVFNKPTLIGVGERGAERVQVTPKGRAPAQAGAGAGGNTYIFNVQPRSDDVRGLRDMVTLMQMAG